MNFLIFTNKRLKDKIDLLEKEKKELNKTIIKLHCKVISQRGEIRALTKEGDEFQTENPALMGQ